MASLYSRPNSPFLWLRWRNPDTRKEDRFSTELRKNIPSEFRRAVQLCHAHTLQEMDGQRPGSDFSKWVSTYIEGRYCNSPKTLTRYRGIWKTIQSYLAEKKITAPDQVTKDIAYGYVPWRQLQPHSNSHHQSGPPIKFNTIIQELKLFTLIMYHALDEGLIARNPCARLKLKKEPPVEKEELDDWHISTILAELKNGLAAAKTPTEKNVARFLFISFEIARFQSVRLNETWIPLDKIDLETRSIRLFGKGQKEYFKYFNPALMPLFAALKKSGSTHTYDKHPSHQFAWFKFFEKLRTKYPGRFDRISFHSTRVTVISRMERAGAPEALVMSAVSNHSSTTVHRIYRRVKRSEIDPFWSAASTAQPLDYGDMLGSSESPDDPQAT